MPARQLTLYDFLADYIPGAVALGYLGALFWFVGYHSAIVPAIPLTIIAGGLAVAGYPLGRLIHAIAGQDEVSKLRRLTFDNLAFALENSRNENGLTESDIAVTDKPTVVGRLTSTEAHGPDIPATTFNDWVDAELMETLTGRADNNARPGLPLPSQHNTPPFSATEIVWSRQSIGQMQRFGFSELFGESTLYQRYNILETFYRNLWLATIYTSLVGFIVGGALALSHLNAFTIRPPVFLTAVLTLAGMLVVGGAFTLLTIRGDTVSDNDDDADTSHPHGPHLLAYIVLSPLIFALPLALLFFAPGPTTAIDGVYLVAFALILFSLAVLLNVRRVQFKDRQVRAFINDLYLHDRERRASSDD